MRKFERIWVPKGQTKQVTFKFNRYDFSLFDVEEHKWRREEGDYEILVGKSSRNILHKVKVENVKKMTE